MYPECVEFLRKTIRVREIVILVRLSHSHGFAQKRNAFRIHGTAPLGGHYLKLIKLYYNVGICNNNNNNNIFTNQYHNIYNNEVKDFNSVHARNSVLNIEIWYILTDIVQNSVNSLKQFYR